MVVRLLYYGLRGESYSCTKDGEEWLYDGDLVLDLEESQVETMLASADIQSSFDKTAEEMEVEEETKAAD